MWLYRPYIRQCAREVKVQTVSLALAFGTLGVQFQTPKAINFKDDDGLSSLSHPHHAGIHHNWVANLLQHMISKY